MENLFHAPFNAALLHAVVLAYPGVAVSFSALAGHAQAVRGLLLQHAPELVAKIEWRVRAADAGSGMVARWLATRRLLRASFAPGERVLFCSISRMQLLALKRQMRPRDVARAVLHGDLDRIAEPVSERFPASLFALNNVLLKPQPAGLRLLLLGDSIRQHLPGPFKAALADAGVIDHPYHFPAIEPLPAGGATVLGTFGNTGDGRMLEAVAQAVKASDPEVRFRLVGFLADDAAVARLAPWVEGAGRVPVAQEVFAERARGLTHTLWLSAPESFRLRASGTFFDALAYGKPLVYTANPFIDPYFAHEPGIGVRCADLAAVPAAIVQLAANRTPATDAAAQAAMARLRERFAPAALAGRLPAALAWD